jgi:hypothetical protein
MLEEAFLHGELINIETKRLELEGRHLKRSEIWKQLNRQYRTLSRKRSFTCRCCNEPVNMNLTKDEGRPFFFKHFDENKCSYSDNTKTYTKHVSTYQDMQKKDIGLTVFKEILEGQLKPFGAIIERGYFYKKKLSFIPDFIVKFPFSEQIWAVDYYTAILHGSYAHNLEKRMNTYISEGFKVISFIDDDWLAINLETDKGTLLSSEINVVNKHKEDINWDLFLNQDITHSELQFLISEIATTPIQINTRSIAYVNIFNRTCTLIRFLETEKNNRNLSFYKISDPTIPLERALTLNMQLDDFLLYRENEDELRQAFKQSLLAKIKQEKLKEIAERERLEKLKREEKKAKEESEKWRRAEEERTRIYRENMQKVEEEIEKEMLEREKAANERPVVMSPEEWEFYKRNPRNFSKPTNGYFQTQTITSYATIEQRIANDKWAKFLERLLSRPITGDQYINGSTEKWRRYILNWISENKVQDEITVSIKKLLIDMKEKGFTFNQKENHVQSTLVNFLNYYQKELKKDLKQKINITFLE